MTANASRHSIVYVVGKPKCVIGCKWQWCHSPSGSAVSHPSPKKKLKRRQETSSLASGNWNIKCRWSTRHAGHFCWSCCASHMRTTGLYFCVFLWGVCRNLVIWMHGTFDIQTLGVFKKPDYYSKMFLYLRMSMHTEWICVCAAVVRCSVLSVSFGALSIFYPND